MPVSITKFCTIAALPLTLVMNTGCTTDQLMRITYDTLRQEDCFYNTLDSYCYRSFALEYHEYKTLRDNYLDEIERENFVAINSDRL